MLVTTAWWMPPIFNLAGAGVGLATGRTVEAIRHRQVDREVDREVASPSSLPGGGEIQLIGAIERLPATDESSSP